MQQLRLDRDLLSAKLLSFTWDAIKYQLLVMFLIAGATGIGAGSAIYAMAARLTDARHRLRLDRLTVK